MIFIPRPFTRACFRYCEASIISRSIHPRCNTSSSVDRHDHSCAFF